jgi:demethylmenaquinone methyltransferase/2-methoxy-6-polyprenyl-1,4-benzoquinol methylase
MRQNRKPKTENPKRAFQIRGLNVHGNPEIRRMFSALVPWYDFLNRLLSLRRDVVWRRQLVAGLPSWPSPTLLDLAAGTLDVSLELSRRFPRGRLVAADFSQAMLQRGQEKWHRQPNPGSLSLAAADAFALPFPNATFDGLTLAFGIRNMEPRKLALQETCRVLKPGGWLAILEFGPPVAKPLKLLYYLYLNFLLPPLGRWFSRHGKAYQYLAASIQAFPAPTAFGQELQYAGFNPSPPLPLSGGIAWVYYAQKS